jgi:hypothetical protein
MLYMLDVITQKHYLVLEIQSDVRWDRVKVNLRQFDAQLCRNEAANHALRYCLEDQCHNHWSHSTSFRISRFGVTPPLIVKVSSSSCTSFNLILCIKHYITMW